jgi:hypothetical protein
MLSLRSFIQRIRPGPRLLENFRNKLIFYGEELAPCNPKAGGPLLVGRPRLLIQYIHGCPAYVEGVVSIRNLRTRHAVVTRDPPVRLSIELTFNSNYRNVFLYASV